MASVTVLYFGVLRERRGVESEAVQIAEGITLATLYQQIFPGPAEGRLPIAFARNETYARGTDVLTDGDDVVFLPPVGGG